jgi:hypothetical protein
MQLEQNYKKELYEVYLAVFKMRDEPHQRRVLIMTNLMGGKFWSWRVVGITRKALERIAEHGFKYKAGSSIHRSHIISRKDMYISMLERCEPMQIDEWWNYFWENDRTIIATGTENNAKAPMSECYEIDPEMGLFQCNPVAGFKLTQKKEGVFLRELYEKKNWLAYHSGQLNDYPHSEINNALPPRIT